MCSPLLGSATELLIKATPAFSPSLNFPICNGSVGQHLHPHQVPETMDFVEERIWGRQKSDLFRALQPTSFLT